MMPHPAVVDWVVDPNTCFLLGAGCSRCAGKPLLDDLTTTVRSKLQKPTQDLLDNLKGSYGRPATVEHLINHLLRLGSLLESKKKPDAGDWSAEQIDNEIEVIKRTIVEAMGSAWAECDVHKNFLRRLAGQKARTTCDIFCLNYDTALEASLEGLRFPYTDGFRGSENAFFERALLEHLGAQGPFFRVFKLHGSVNWVRDDDGTVRRRPAAAVEDRHRLVIYPTEQKYLQTQYGIYETLLELLRKRLRDSRPNNTLVVLGYSFGDEHINLAIEDSICADGSNLTVYALIGPEIDTAAQTKRIQEMVDRCQSRFNALIGQDSFLGAGLEPGEWDAIKGMDLWRFENLVQLISGVRP